MANENPSEKSKSETPASGASVHDGANKKSGGLLRVLVYLPVLLLLGTLGGVAANPQLAEKLSFLIGEERPACKTTKIAVHESNIPTGMLRSTEEGEEKVLVREKEEESEAPATKVTESAANESKE